METPFLHVSNEAEPHRIRRRELLKRYPELKKLIGFSYGTSAIILAVVAAQLGIAWLVQRGLPGGWWLVVPLAYVVGGTLNHWAGMGIHEASHNLVAKSEPANRVMAIIANIPIVFPSAMSFRRYHLKHHSHLGIEGADNDLATAWEITWVGRSPFKKVIWMLFYPIFAAFARDFVRKPSGWEIANIAFQILVAAAIWKLIGGAGLGYLGLSTFFGYGLLHPTSAHFIHEHYIWKPGQETYSYYGPLNWVTFHVGYHNEHHDIMSIPCWKLPTVKRTAPEFYDTMIVHRSWTWVLWHFISNPGVGHESRIVRPWSTMAKRTAPTLPGVRPLEAETPLRLAA